MRYQKLIIGLDSFTNQRYIFGSVWIILDFVSTLQNYSIFLWLHFATEEA